MSLDRLKEVGLILVGAVSLYLAFSKLNLWFLSPLTFLILLARKRLKFWLLLGFLGFSLSLSWVHIASHKYGQVFSPVAWFLVLLLAGVLALYQFGGSFLLWRLTGFRLYLFPFIWVGVEFLRSNFPYGGFPWFLTGSLMLDIPFLKFNLSTLKVFGAGILFLLILTLPFSKGLRYRSFVVALTLFLTYLSLWIHYSRLNPYEDKLRVALIQPAIPQDVKLSEEEFRQSTPIYIKLIEKAIGKGAQIVFLPESAFYFFISELRYEGKEILKLSEKAPIVVGMVDVDFENLIAYNSVVVIYRGRVEDRYNKIKLLPFGEYIPKPFGFAKEVFSAIAGIDYVPGEKIKPLGIEELKMATAICFEVAYCSLIKELSKDANFLVVLTNDAWFENSDGTYQHMKLARLRALENTKFLLWVNNTGPSAVISPEGKVLKSLGYMERGILLYELPVNSNALLNTLNRPE